MCENKVEFYIPSGVDYRLVEVSCGNTDPNGNRAICKVCRKDTIEMDSINRHKNYVEDWSFIDS